MKVTNLTCPHRADRR